MRAPHFLLIYPGGSTAPPQVLGINFAAAVGESSQNNNYAIPSWHVEQMLHESAYNGRSQSFVQCCYLQIQVVASPMILLPFHTLSSSRV